MNKYLQISLLSGLLIFPTAAALAANMQPAAPIANMMDLLNKLDAAGYHQIKEIELGKSGTYKVDTIDEKGRELQFTVDPAKPYIKPLSQQVLTLPTLEIAKKVTEAGYKNITKIKNKGDKYEVKAQDNQGKAVKLEVNMVTGEIHKDWF